MHTIIINLLLQFFGYFLVIKIFHFFLPVQEIYLATSHQIIKYTARSPISARVKAPSEFRLEKNHFRAGIRLLTLFVHLINLQM